MTHWQNFYHDASAEELDEYLEQYQRLLMFRRHWPRRDVLNLLTHLKVNRILL